MAVSIHFLVEKWVEVGAPASVCGMRHCSRPKHDVRDRKIEKKISFYYFYLAQSSNLKLHFRWGWQKVFHGWDLTKSLEKLTLSIDEKVFLFFSNLFATADTTKIFHWSLAVLGQRGKSESGTIGPMDRHLKEGNRFLEVITF